MHLDATTFALEVLNFLVLVWLLKRFLYKPVLDVIERRRVEDMRSATQARALHDEALALKATYEHQLAGAAEDRRLAQEKLEGEVAAERARRMAAVEAEVRADLERRHALAARDAERQAAEQERLALEMATLFASRMLGRLAGPALEDGLVDLVLADLPALPTDQRETLRSAMDAGDALVQVASAYPLPSARREAVQRVLEALAGRPLAPAFVEDPSLKAGLRVAVGDWVLMANLRDELTYFGARLDHGG